MMNISTDQLKEMTDAQIAAAIASGDIKNLSNFDWDYLGKAHPESLKIYAVVLGVLGILKF